MKKTHRYRERAGKCLHVGDIKLVAIVSFGIESPYDHALYCCDCGEKCETHIARLIRKTAT